MMVKNYTPFIHQLEFNNVIFPFLSVTKWKQGDIIRTEGCVFQSYDQIVAGSCSVTIKLSFSRDKETGDLLLYTSHSVKHTQENIKIDTQILRVGDNTILQLEKTHARLTVIAESDETITVCILREFLDALNIHDTKVLADCNTSIVSFTNEFLYR